MNHKVSVLAAAAGLTGLVAGGLFFDPPSATASPPQPKPVVVPVPTPAPVPITGPVQTPAGGISFVQLAKQVGPAVVSLDVRVNRRASTLDPFSGLGPRTVEGQGSGFVISADGYILTNDHVIGQAESITVTFSDGRELPGRVVGTDERTDIGLIKVDSKVPLPYIALGDSDRLEVGEWVIAIGNPFGLDHTVTAGIVSAKGRRHLRPSGRGGQFDFIQTDASINPGNSGGPLINVRGEVVGINAAVNMAGQGIGFAIPVNMAKTLLPMLKDNGKVSRSWLGVRVQDMSAEMARSLSLPSNKGALIADVVDGSPASKAGLKSGDVIVSVDGKPVDDASTLTWLVSTAGSGKTVRVSLLRKGARSDVPVKLEPLPDDDALAARTVPGDGKAQAVSRLGVEVQPVTAEVARQLSLDGARGVLVTKVTRTGGMQPLTRGDVIVAVGDEQVGSTQELARAVGRVAKGELVRMLVVRQGAPMWLAFTLP